VFTDMNNSGVDPKTSTGSGDMTWARILPEPYESAIPLPSAGAHENTLYAKQAYSSVTVPAPVAPAELVLQPCWARCTRLLRQRGPRPEDA
jgi:hypothetical protein